jgi:hypothetical protein
VLRYAARDFAVAAGKGPNLFEVHAGGASLEGARLLVHALGWNAFFVEAQELTPVGHVLSLTPAPGTKEIRLPQFLLASPGERRPGNPVPVTRANFRLQCGPGPAARIEITFDGPPGVNAMLELAARPDQRLFSGDGAPLEAPYAAPPMGRTVVRGAGRDLLVLDHTGGSGHALQIAPYGYGAGDATWSPSFHPRVIRFGIESPGTFVLEIHRA